MFDEATPTVGEITEKLAAFVEAMKMALFVGVMFAR